MIRVLNAVHKDDMGHILDWFDEEGASLSKKGFHTSTELLFTPNVLCDWGVSIVKNNGFAGKIYLFKDLEEKRDFDEKLMELSICKN